MKVRESDRSVDLVLSWNEEGKLKMGKRLGMKESYDENYSTPIKSRARRVNLDDLLLKIKIDKKKERHQSFLTIASVLVLMVGFGIFFFY